MEARLAKIMSIGLRCPSIRELSSGTAVLKPFESGRDHSLSHNMELLSTY